MKPICEYGNRLQFRLCELLFVLLLGCVGMFLVLPSVAHGQWFTSTGEWPVWLRETLLKFGLALAAATAVGGLWSASAAIRMGALGWRKYLGIAAAVLLFWSPILWVSHGWRTVCIQENETLAMSACEIYVSAQERHRLSDWDGDEETEFSQTLSELMVSNHGAPDGRTLAKMAAAEGPPGEAPPCNGYVFKVLTAQGNNAIGGRMRYLKPSPDGKAMNLFYGHALAACPAEYGWTGVHTYIVSHLGTVHKKDFGTATPRIFAEMTEFDPPYATYLQMSTWGPVAE